jgi:glycosyltransferase involved in cell wall biosynthesis
MAEKKTVALCLEYPLSLRGGVSVLVETMLPALKEHYRLVLVSPDAPGNLERTPAAGVIAKHIFWEPGAVSRETSQALAKQLADEKVDLAHFHLGGNFGWGNRFPGQCPILYAERLGVRTCSTVHLVAALLDGFCGPQKPLWFKLGLLPMAWYSKMQVLRRVRTEIAVSQHDAGKLRRWYWPAAKKFRVIYHSRIKQAARAGAGQREPMILNVGHIAARKGQLVLAEAFAEIAPRHPEWKLWLVGHVAEEDVNRRIRDLARAHQIEGRIVLTGPRDDAQSFMSRAAIYAQPSIFEALGLALQEAMAAGCACVGSRAGGIPELIDDEKSGLLVPPGDARALARSLELLISDAALREKYGRAAAEGIVAKGMTEESMVKKHLGLYEKILSGA